MMTSAQVVETSVNVTNNSPSRDYSHPDDQTTQTTFTLQSKFLLNPWLQVPFHFIFKKEIRMSQLKGELWKYLVGWAFCFS